MSRYRMWFMLMMNDHRSQTFMTVIWCFWVDSSFKNGTVLQNKKTPLEERKNEVKHCREMANWQTHRLVKVLVYCWCWESLREPVHSIQWDACIQEHTNTYCCCSLKIKPDILSIHQCTPSLFRMEIPSQEICLSQYRRGWPQSIS